MFHKHRLLQSPEVDVSAGGADAAKTGDAAKADVASDTGKADAGKADAGKADAAVKATWPEQWREAYAKEDTKKLEKLKRYGSPDAAFDAMIAAQNRISAGELLPALGKNPTEAQLKEWREAFGIPAEPSKYDLAGIPVSEAGKPTVDKFLALAHKTNQTPEQVRENLRFLGQMAADAKTTRHENDAQLLVKYEDQLRAEWGAEYKSHLGSIHSVLDGAVGPELKEKLLGARMDDGTPIGTSPEMLKFLLHLALIKNPAGSVVPGAGANPLKGVNEEIARIEGFMKTDRKKYNADAKMQDDLRKLYDAREQLQKRAA